MTPEIKNMNNWKEASRWLAKHGWGMAQIAEQKVLWDEANLKVIDTETVTKPVHKPVAKPTNDKAPEKPDTVKPKAK